MLPDSAVAGVRLRLFCSYLDLHFYCSCRRCQSPSLPCHGSRQVQNNQKNKREIFMRHADGRSTKRTPGLHENETISDGNSRFPLVIMIDLNRGTMLPLITRGKKRVSHSFVKRCCTAADLGADWKQAWFITNKPIQICATQCLL